jgi:hypothetical protein
MTSSRAVADNWLTLDKPDSIERRPTCTGKEAKLRLPRNWFLRVMLLAIMPAAPS